MIVMIIVFYVMMMTIADNIKERNEGNSNGKK